jgi:hypothetical protein
MMLAAPPAAAITYEKE